MCDVGWRDRKFHPEEVSASGNSDREELAAHDAETTNAYNAQKSSETRPPGAVRPVRHITGRTPHPRASA